MLTKTLTDITCELILGMLIVYLLDLVRAIEAHAWPQRRPLESWDTSAQDQTTTCMNPNNQKKLVVCAVTR